MKLIDNKLNLKKHRIFDKFKKLLKKLIKNLSCSKKIANIYKNIQKKELENINIDKYINNIDSKKIINQTDPYIILQ